MVYTVNVLDMISTSFCVVIAVGFYFWIFVNYKKRK